MQISWCSFGTSVVSMKRNEKTTSNTLYRYSFATWCYFGTVTAEGFLQEAFGSLWCFFYSVHFSSYTSWLKLQTDGIFFMQDATIFEVQHSIPWFLYATDIDYWPENNIDQYGLLMSFFATIYIGKKWLHMTMDFTLLCVGALTRGSGSQLVNAACFLVSNVDARGHTVMHGFILVPATGPYVQQRGCECTVLSYTWSDCSRASEAREGGRLPSLC